MVGEIDECQRAAVRVTGTRPLHQALQDLDGDVREQIGQQGGKARGAVAHGHERQGGGDRRGGAAEVRDPAHSVP